MRKLISCLLLSSFSLVVVLCVPLKQDHFAKDVGDHTAVLADMKPAIDAFFINDAVVPVVQSHYTCHNAKKEILESGFQPTIEAKVRGPTSYIQRQHV